MSSLPRRKLACTGGGRAIISAENMRLLIVEDEPDLLSSLAQALREDGYAVDAAADGEEGLYKAENWEYDAIVLDIMLPKLDGWAVVQKLRKSKKTPVLMLTARDQTRDRVRCRGPGRLPDQTIRPVRTSGAAARPDPPQRGPDA